MASSDICTPAKAPKGWTFPWYSSYTSNFNYDLHVTLDPTALGRQEDWEEPKGRTISAHGAIPDFSA